MQNHGPRSTKLLQAVQKTIETTLESSKKHKATTEGNEDVVKEKLKELFDHYITETLLQKLDTLDKQIEEKRINLRSIKCENYIKEILESYIVDEKIDKINFFDEQIKKEKQKKEVLTKTIEEMNKINGEYDKKINANEMKIEKVVNIINKPM